MLKSLYFNDKNQFLLQNNEAKSPHSEQCCPTLNWTASRSALAAPRTLQLDEFPVEEDTF